jgi:hypothetical protein
MNWSDVSVHLSLDGWGEIPLKDAQLCNDKLKEMLADEFPGINIDDESWELIEYESDDKEKALAVKDWVEENFNNIIINALGFKEI